MHECYEWNLIPLELRRSGFLECAWSPLGWVHWLVLWWHVWVVVWAWWWWACPWIVGWCAYPWLVAPLGEHYHHNDECIENSWELHDSNIYYKFYFIQIYMQLIRSLIFLSIDVCFSFINSFSSYHSNQVEHQLCFSVSYQILTENESGKSDFGLSFFAFSKEIKKKSSHKFTLAQSGFRPDRFCWRVKLIMRNWNWMDFIWRNNERETDGVSPNVQTTYYFNLYEIKL